MSQTLGRIDFAAARNIIKVEVPELGGSFNLRALSIAQMNIVKQSDNDAAKHLALVIVDDQGQQMYQTAEEIANLSEMSYSAMKILVDAMNEQNGFNAAALEAAAKNSAASPNSGSVIA